MADTLPSETINPEAPSNEATPVVTPAPSQGNATDTAEVERLRKELEQIANASESKLTNKLSEARES
jgi:hypothetical protein